MCCSSFSLPEYGHCRSLREYSPMLRAKRGLGSSVNEDSCVRLVVRVWFARRVLSAMSVTESSAKFGTIGSTFHYRDFG